MPHRTKTVEGTSKRAEEITCPKCGESNARVHNVCQQCGAHLHKSLLRQLEKKMFLRQRGIKVWQIALLIGAVWVAYKLLVAVSEFGLKSIL
jgi:hypothetical protein